MNNRIHNLRYLKDRRRTLRKDLTKAEACLWTLLKNKQAGRKFRRQHSIKNYIVDFYCPEERLIIELDGEIHNNLGLANADDYRDKHLTELGFRVIRFDNEMVFRHPEWVIMLIQEEFNKR